MRITKNDIEKVLTPKEFGDFLGLKVKRHFSSEEDRKKFVSDVRFTLFGDALDDGTMPKSTRSHKGNPKFQSIENKLRFSIKPPRRVRCAICVAGKITLAIVIVAEATALIAAGIGAALGIAQLEILFGLSTAVATACFYGASVGSVAILLCDVC